MNDKIKRLRTQTIKGLNVDLVPFDEEYIADIIKIRNQDKARYFLQQHYNISFEQQRQWMETYKQLNDDIGFIITDKKQNVIGIIFLYNYSNTSIEIGRVTFDLEKIMGKPYTIEAPSIILDLAFDYLNVQEVVAYVKDDNPLIKFNLKFGFILT